MSSTVSRVLYRMIIYLDCTLPYSSFVPCGTKRDIPESTTGRRIAFCFVLLRVGFTQPLTLPQERWSLTPPFHPYRQSRRFLFCCTGLRVAPTGRYPAPCPAEPGLSSPERARSSVLLGYILAHFSGSVKVAVATCFTYFLSFGEISRVSERRRHCSSDMPSM